MERERLKKKKNEEGRRGLVGAFLIPTPYATYDSQAYAMEEIGDKGR